MLQGFATDASERHRSIICCIIFIPFFENRGYIRLSQIIWYSALSKRLIVDQEISLKKISTKATLVGFFFLIKVISNHSAFVLLLFSSANFITDSNKYTIASKNISKFFDFYMLRKYTTL